jgi:hypothetical protein
MLGGDITTLPLSYHEQEPDVWLYYSLILWLLVPLDFVRHRDFRSFHSLTSVVKYLSPIMEDSGFRAVLENIRLSLVVGIKRLLPVDEYMAFKVQIMRDSFDVRKWINAIQQLWLASTSKVSVCIWINSRAAWLAALTTHVLNMDCRVCFSSTSLWETTGSCRSAFI